MCRCIYWYKINNLIVFFDVLTFDLANCVCTHVCTSVCVYVTVCVRVSPRVCSRVRLSVYLPVLACLFACLCEGAGVLIAWVGLMLVPLCIRVGMALPS